jgi:formyl-CoA transferase
MGIGPDVLHVRNLQLIIARISGCGQTGPRRHKPGFGFLVEMLSGFAAMKWLPGRGAGAAASAAAGSVARLYGAVGGAAALRQAERTRMGRVLDLALFDGILSVLGPQALDHQVSGRAPLHQEGLAPSNVYRTADGWMALSTWMQGSVERLFVALGRPALIRNPRFSSPEVRQANVDALHAIIGGAIATRNLAENFALFEAAGVTASAVLDATELRAHSYMRERGAILNLSDAELGRAAIHAPPIRFEESAAPAITMPAPALSEHSATLLREVLAHPKTESQSLLTEGVITVPSSKTAGNHAT